MMRIQAQRRLRTKQSSPPEELLAGFFIRAIRLSVLHDLDKSQIKSFLFVVLSPGQIVMGLVWWAPIFGPRNGKKGRSRRMPLAEEPTALASMVGRWRCQRHTCSVSPDTTHAINPNGMNTIDVMLPQLL